MTIWRNLRLRRSPFVAMVALVISDVGVGAVYCFGPPAWTSTPSLYVHKQIAPIEVWGACFLVVGLGAAIIGFTRKYELWQFLALMGAVVTSAWAIGYWATAIAGKLQGGAGLFVPAFFALMHYVIATEARFMRRGHRD